MYSNMSLKQEDKSTQRINTSMLASLNFDALRRADKRDMISALLAADVEFHVKDAISYMYLFSLVFGLLVWTNHCT